MGARPGRSKIRQSTAPSQLPVHEKKRIVVATGHSSAAASVTCRRLTPSDSIDSFRAETAFWRYSLPEKKSLSAPTRRRGIRRNPGPRDGHAVNFLLIIGFFWQKAHTNLGVWAARNDRTWSLHVLPVHKKSPVTTTGPLSWKCGVFAASTRPPPLPVPTVSTLFETRCSYAAHPWMRHA